MKRVIKMAVLCASFTVLAGCQQMNSDLNTINSDVSGITHGSLPESSGGTFQNQWGITNVQAMAWLAQNNMSWNDNGAIPAGVNWYRFWAQQAHYQTALGAQAKSYCEQPAWSNISPGTNCRTYLQALTDSAADSIISN